MATDKERAYIEARSRVNALIDALQFTSVGTDAYRNIATMINEGIGEVDRAAVKLADEAVGGESFQSIILKRRVQLPGE